MRWLQAIDRRLFRWGSPVTLAVFRILAAGLALTNFLMIAIDFDAWFTENGYLPAWFASRWTGGLWRINFLSGVQDERITVALYALVVLAALLVTVGLVTRPASIVLFLGAVTLHHRSPDILHSGDSLMRAWLFVLMISPCAQALSVDRLIRLARGVASGPPPSISIWPQRLVQFQLAVVYLTTVWHKWGGSDWRDGTAVWYTINMAVLSRFPLPGILTEPALVAMATYGTLAIELAMATLVFFRPLRSWVLLSGLLFHLGIEYSMNIALFAFTICCGYVCFYDGEELESAWRLVRARLRPRSPSTES